MTTGFGKVPRVTLALAALCVFAAAPPAGAAFKYLKTGMEAPDFVLKAHDDKEISLAQLKESPASLLVFWATWSPRYEPVLREAQALHERYGAKGLRVVAVNVNHQEIGLQERGLVEKAARDLGLTIQVAFDPGLATCTGFGVVANPSLALFDARGALVFDAGGWSKSVQEACREQVEGLLGLRQAPASAAGNAAHKPERKALLAFNLGRTFMRQGNRAKALGQFEAAAEGDPAWAPPRVVLGHARLQEGTEAGLRGAEELFRAAIAIDPRDVSAVAGLGEVLLRTGRVDEAAAQLERAIALDASFTPAISGRAQALARQGKLAEALALFEEALALNPRDAAVWVGRAECREQAGSAKEAAADYRQAVEILLGRK